MRLALAVPCALFPVAWQTIELKGFDELTSLFHIGEGERESTTVAIDAGESTDDSSGDFEEMPSFTTPR